MQPLIIPYNINGRQRLPPIDRSLSERTAKTSSTEINGLPNIEEEDPAVPPRKADRKLGPTHLPTRTSNSSKQECSPDSSGSDHDSGHGSSVDGSPSSSNGTNITHPTFASSPLESALQGKDLDEDVTPKVQQEDYDLATTVEDSDETSSLETFSGLLFSGEHLKSIFADSSSLLSFNTFLSEYRPQSVPILLYYLDASKALKAFNHANAIAEGLGSVPGHDFTSIPTKSRVNPMLEKKAEKAFDMLVQEDLPAYITHLYVQVAKSNMLKRVTTTTVPVSREGPEGLSEVVCLTEPSRPDNPIVFVSEAFHQLTQYGVHDTIGRNCRFLQGPKTNLAGVRRLRRSIEAGQEHCEVILNYRRDGSPFLNLLTQTPLRDANGILRYWLGAQVDVSDLFPADLASLQRLMSQHKQPHPHPPSDDSDSDSYDDASFHHPRTPDLLTPQPRSGRSPSLDSRRLASHLRSPSLESTPPKKPPSAFHTSYMLVRPYPSLRVLFASPSLPRSIVQTPIQQHIDCSAPDRDDLMAALAAGRGVTARMLWIANSAREEHRLRWIQFTPLLRRDGGVGVWVVGLVDDDDDDDGDDEEGSRAARTTPPAIGSAAAGKTSASDFSSPPRPQRAETNDDATAMHSLDSSSTSTSGTSKTSTATSQTDEDDADADADGSGDGGEFLSLEARLRRRRARDGMGGGGLFGAGGRTYKSLDPYVFPIFETGKDADG